MNCWTFSRFPLFNLCCRKEMHKKKKRSIKKIKGTKQVHIGNDFCLYYYMTITNIKLHDSAQSYSPSNQYMFNKHKETM